MKALSIRQPWAWLIVNGYKDVENRVWPTYFRGEFLVHAPKTIDRSVKTEHFRDFGVPIPLIFQTGGIVGKARIVDCVRKFNSHWFAGPFGFVLVDPEPLPFVPMRGQLGFFEVNMEEKK